MLPKLNIKGFTLDSALWQGGMGVGVSRNKLAGAVSKEGAFGILSSAGLRGLISAQLGSKVDAYTATRMEIEIAQDLSGGRPIGINIMCALVGDYEDSVRGAIDAGAAAIISGAGLPMGLPKIKNPGDTALVPIVSSARALDLILKKWGRDGYRPDAVVVEGPRAGGHLGFKAGDVNNPEFALENILPPVLDLVSKHGDFPVIAAGGIYTHEDILKFLAMGAKGVQMGTRFLATKESSATEAYKQAVVAAGVNDIMVVSYPESKLSSPCGLPFRILTTSPAYNIPRVPKCDKGFVLQRDKEGKLSVCPAKPNSQNCGNFFCICSELLASGGFGTDPELWTVGTNAYRVNEILSVKDLVSELRGA